MVRVTVFRAIECLLSASRYDIFKIFFYFISKPTSSQFHIAWGLNDNKNYVTITENQPLNKWIHLEISQSKTSTGKYVHDVKVDGRNYAGVVQEQPKDYVDLIVYAANPFGETAHAQIRNFKITTQSKFFFCSFFCNF